MAEVMAEATAPVTILEAVNLKVIRSQKIIDNMNIAKYLISHTGYL